MRRELTDISEEEILHFLGYGENNPDEQTRSVLKEMKQLQVQDMMKAVLFDSCASAAIEAVCDNLQKELQKSYPYLTDRYSCGYGDLPITLQASFLQALDAQRRIGLHVNESSLLVPMKSVTAIIGIADRIQPAVLRGCGHCQLVKQCAYRKRGKFCGN